MLAEICNGEVKQLRAAGNANLPVAAYLEIIGKKTAELFAACAEVGAIVALQQRNGAPDATLRDVPVVKALRAYGWAFGMAFQIRDDLLDVTANESVLGKPAGSDLREKKVTLPLVYALADGGPAERACVDALFSQDAAAETRADERLDSVVGIIRSGSALPRTMRAIGEYATAAQAALSVVAPSNARDELHDLAQTLTEFSS
jgi:octaprenyl-diphosphate synthase